MRTLGISAFYHDSAAALIEDGRIIAASQEERFTRKKHDASFPQNAIQFCLEFAKVTLPQVDYVAFYDKPFLKFERLLETYVAFAPRGFGSFRKAMPLWLREKLFQKDLLSKALRTFDSDFDCKNKLLFAEHHQSHAASAFFPSPFEDAVILTLDGVGEWATSSVAIGKDNQLEVIREIHFPHSLGLLYSTFTAYAGFKVNSGEYKLMGLAPYGEAKYASTILDHLIDLKEDGSFRINQSYFNYCAGLTMTNRKFEVLFGGPPRCPEDTLQQRHMDIAASIQKVIEEVLLRMTRAIARETKSKNLCLAGGVALNCVANGKILRDRKFDRLWIQPAAGDAGGAVGAALCAYHLFEKQRRVVANSLDAMDGSYLGPSFDQCEIDKRLQSVGAQFEVVNTEQLVDQVAAALADGKVVGWFQGRMEFGPRSLGNRSILADARSPAMQKLLNLKVKNRESFRPFAPSVLREEVQDWFELNADSPYMLIVADVAARHRRSVTATTDALKGLKKLNFPRSSIPAVTHVDGSARIQTVHRETNPRFHSLLQAFKNRTGCPVLVNTSFNIRGEPIVCTPEDAFRCFMGTDIELLAIGNCLLRKESQTAISEPNYKDAFERD